jgi:hypothetical protein
MGQASEAYYLGLSVTKVELFMTLTTEGNRFLFWCANEHLNFRIPEFESLTRYQSDYTSYLHLVTQAAALVRGKSFQRNFTRKY